MGEFLVSECVLAYTAGIIDGEGCIGIYALKAGKRGKDSERIYHTLRVEVCNAQKGLIEFLFSHFGGSHGAGYRPNRKPYYKWQITSRSAAEFLDNIYPYLVIKRDQAELVVRFRGSFGNPGKVITADRMEFRAKCHSELHRLKRIA